MQYINNGGLELFRKFLKHLGNYSIMQIVERLFLHQPGWDREGMAVVVVVVVMVVRTGWFVL